MVKQHIDTISSVYDAVKINKYVIMPNHIHMIVVIEGETPNVQGDIPDAQGGIPDTQGGIPDAQGGIPDTQGGIPDTQGGTPGCASPTKSVLAKVINAFKSLTSRQFGESMWQRGYHDRIIRDETEYMRIWQYIDENPAKWAEDEYCM